MWFRQREDYLAFVHDLQQFKDTLFGERPDSPVILHRTDIINRRGAFGVLCDEDKRKRFDDGLLQLITGARFKINLVYFYDTKLGWQPLSIQRDRCQAKHERQVATKAQA